MRYVIRFVPSLGLPNKEVEATDYVKTEEDYLFHNEDCPFYRVAQQYVMSVEVKPNEDDALASPR